MKRNNDLYNRDKYDGEWENDIKKGKGIYYHNNGDMEKW